MELYLWLRVLFQMGDLALPMIPQLVGLLRVHASLWGCPVLRGFSVFLSIRKESKSSLVCGEREARSNVTVRPPCQIEFGDLGVQGSQTRL